MSCDTLCDGVFDPLHVGHLEYLAIARALAIGPLMVNVAPDEIVRSKRGGGLFQTAEERQRMLRSIRGVDRVTSMSLPAAIREHGPRLVVKGKEWLDTLPTDVTVALADTGATVAFVETPNTLHGSVRLTRIYFHDTERV